MRQGTEREYTNGRIRVRPEQIEYLDTLLHRTWVELSRQRAEVKDMLDQPPFTGGDKPQWRTEDTSLVTMMNRELRLIKTIQDEIKRTREEMESRAQA